MDQHEESVYKVAWSPADAWIYCSLSYDGRYFYVILHYLAHFLRIFLYLCSSYVIYFLFYTESSWITCRPPKSTRFCYKSAHFYASLLNKNKYWCVWVTLFFNFANGTPAITNTRRKEAVDARIRTTILFTGTIITKIKAICGENGVQNTMTQTNKKKLTQNVNNPK